ncbi:tetratricopeptide repeat protein [Dinghuibacter silviterrae]|uniref:Tetratricopeptide repeat protein n=1 Tax=Dinghuibacter silviterrae TaxID=1539049 RepID=A0A4R8DGJ4_9BACT|nr:tetratricopeptide repeat protein [Dinghuibacter silviterrae]TDW96773.1 tetratricopeptide repeat protein [Dinghuibacter silviterrae]
MDRIALLKQHLETSPDDPFLQHALALELVKMGDDEGARASFERLLSKDPTYVGSYYHLAKLLERTGHTDEAIAVYERGMDAARASGDRKALGELRSAYEELTM